MARSTITFLIAVTTVFGAVVFASTTTGALWYAPESEMPIAPPDFSQKREAGEGDYPVRLKIPALGIDAFVQQVGINAKGNMAAPSNFTDVGWYKYGTLPGFTGSAVITGHVDNALSLAGVFKRLNSLRIGDDVIVEKKDGGELLFRVTEVQRYPVKLVPLSIIFSRSDLPRLNLITCEGDWLPGEHMYDERLVVYSELISG